jgi:hypothetical protein
VLGAGLPGLHRFGSGLGTGGNVFTVCAALVPKVGHVLLDGRAVEQGVGQVAVRRHVDAVVRRG